MGLMQTGSTLEISGGTATPIGDMELLYSCDGCEERTGDPYSKLSFVVMRRDGEVLNASSVAGWTFYYDEDDKACTRAYCRDCSSV
jgi:hypothetical protein